MRGFAALLGFILSLILMSSLSVGEVSRRTLLNSALEARENKIALYTARNVEETFWQTLSETAIYCKDCSQEELSFLVNQNVKEWLSFWEKEGVDFVFAEDIKTISDEPSGFSDYLIYSSFVETSSGRTYFFSVQGANVYGNVHNRTWAIILKNDERTCFLVGERCVWKTS